MSKAREEFFAVVRPVAIRTSLLFRMLIETNTLLGLTGRLNFNHAKQTLEVFVSITGIKDPVTQYVGGYFRISCMKIAWELFLPIDLWLFLELKVLRLIYLSFFFFFFFSFFLFFFKRKFQIFAKMESPLGILKVPHLKKFMFLFFLVTTFYSPTNRNLMANCNRDRNSITHSGAHLPSVHLFYSLWPYKAGITKGV